MVNSKKESTSNTTSGRRAAARGLSPSPRSERWRRQRLDWKSGVVQGHAWAMAACPGVMNFMKDGSLSVES